MLYKNDVTVAPCVNVWQNLGAWIPNYV